MRVFFIFIFSQENIGSQTSGRFMICLTCSYVCFEEKNEQTDNTELKNTKLTPSVLFIWALLGPFIWALGPGPFGPILGDSFGPCWAHSFGPWARAHFGPFIWAP